MKKISVLLLLSLILFSGFSQSTICSYKFRKRITFDPLKVSGPVDLTNFPALIKIASDPDLKLTTSLGHVENSNGYDIIFTADDGTTVLDQQMESYTSTTGQYTAWVRIPVLSTTVSTVIYMYYGNAAATTNPSSTTTWDANYAAVYHFAGNLNNSTSAAGLTGTNNGTNNSTGGIIDRYRNLVRSSKDYIDVTPYNNTYDITGTITVSAWIRLNSLNQDQKIAGNEDGATGGWKFGVYTDNKLEFEIRTSANSPSLTRTGTCPTCATGTALATATWYYVTGEYSDAGDFITTYINGVADRSYTGNTTVMGSSGGTLKFGIEPFDVTSAAFDGDIDEIHISNSIRSADWLVTEYNNQSSPSTFYSISAEPYRWTGATSTNWNTTTNWSSGLVPPSDVDIIISNGTNQPTLAGNTQAKSIWIQSGATLSLSSFSLLFRTDVTNCGTISGGTGTLTANGTAQPSQYLSGSGTYNLYNLTINNTYATSPSVTMNRTASVSGALTLSSGILYSTLTNILNLGATATSSSGSTASFVSGPMTKAGTAAFVFPTGKGTSWRRIAISAPTTSTTFRAEYFNTAYTNTTTVTAPLTDVSSVEYWVLDQASGTGSAKVTLYWENAATSGINNCPDLTVAHWTGAAWDEKPAVATGTCSGTGTGSATTSAVVSTFSPFTFGSKSGVLNPLPIELIRFDAKPCDKKVCVTWETASETNNDFFTVERSSDGIHFDSIEFANGSGTSSAFHSYSSQDILPLEGLGYYRLKQTDFDGRHSFSKIVTVSFSGADSPGVSVYPNPSVSETVNIEISGLMEKSAELSIYDPSGKKVFYRYIDRIEKNHQQFEFNIPPALSPGLYCLTLISGDAVLYQKLVIR
ncbi:MAG: DUF2341 domain-containing protein [Bacteroidia bacterium]